MTVVRAFYGFSGGSSKKNRHPAVKEYMLYGIRLFQNRAVIPMTQAALFMHPRATGVPVCYVRKNYTSFYPVLPYA